MLLVGDRRRKKKKGRGGRECRAGWGKPWGVLLDQRISSSSWSWCETTEVVFHWDALAALALCAVDPGRLHPQLSVSLPPPYLPSNSFTFFLLGQSRACDVVPMGSDGCAPLFPLLFGTLENSSGMIGIPLINRPWSFDTCPDDNVLKTDMF